MADGTTTARTGYTLPVDPLNALGDPEPIFRNAAQLQFMRTLISIIREQFGKFINRDTAAPYFYLQSPNGKTYRVAVSDDGVLQVTNARS